jgi:hypothetical protein
MTKDMNKTCETRIDRELEGRVCDLKILWEACCRGESDDNLGNLADYGLSFDYVAAGTFDDQREAYFRYQLSWGGPSDEFRFFVNPDLTCHRVEYWFLDWFDGAHRICTGEGEKLTSILWEWMCEGALPHQLMNKSDR